MTACWRSWGTRGRRLLARLLGEGRTWELYFRSRSLWRGPNKRYSIGVVTYLARLDSHFRPLFRQLMAWFADTPVLVAINGYYDVERQRQYLRKIGAFLEPFPNVMAIPNREPQSLSRLWNQLALHTPTPRLLVFNDDLLLAPSFRRELELSPLLDQDVALINASWSHFLISGTVMQAAGWFDERFPGIGNEDEDYEARLALLDKALPSIRLQGIRNLVHSPSDYSYGKDMPIAHAKYSAANLEFFQRKWRVSSVPLPGYTWVRILDAFVQLREGMETPDFYPGLSWGSQTGAQPGVRDAGRLNARRG